LLPHHQVKGLIPAAVADSGKVTEILKNIDKNKFILKNTSFQFYKKMKVGDAVDLSGLLQSLQEERAAVAMSIFLNRPPNVDNIQVAYVIKLFCP
jgi:hydroxyacyl-ACP dehydratase HTD2-like protein with hotdog domain